ncbi:putative quinol monooxygenase [Salinicola avicenniae]|uniref:putative quinol monooxygenase n=1 Tax=Salinicola avicenniae TaxID=2916836 RepID=UPI002073D36F|nr:MULTISPECIES: putative quinol monooxygenase [unclassified Salinicola]
MSKVSCVAITTAKPGYEERVREALVELVKSVREEPGNIRYEMHRDLEDRGRFVCMEIWEDREAFDRHCTAPHILAYLEANKDAVESTEFAPLEILA